MNFEFSLFLSSSGAKYNYDRFPSNIRTEEQEEKRKQILATASGALRYFGKHICFVFFLNSKDDFINHSKISRSKKLQ